ncbi:MAG: condensation domain-containing protein, partial [Candidatus Binataceae bacterium]
MQQAVVVAMKGEAETQKLVAHLVSREALERPPGDSSLFENEKVNEWKAVFEDTYTKGHPNVPDYDTRGWQSTYTHQDLSADEMREWTDQTLERIAALGARRVLEIGCGTGLLALGLADGCEEYLGTDFSAAALAGLSERLAAKTLSRSKAHLIRRDADDFDFGPEFPSEFDTIILNSIVQYFPSVEYLLRVLAGAIAKTRSGGAVFVGDVRNLALLRMFYGSIEFHRARDDLLPREVARRAEQRLSGEKEFVLDPRFWPLLRDRFQRIDAVEVYLKRGRSHNELNCFRYDVILHIESGRHSDVSESINWTPSLDPEVLRESAERWRPGCLEIRKIPNGRLATERAVLDWLGTESALTTVGEFRRHLANSFSKSTNVFERGIDPDMWWRAFEGSAYGIEISWARADPLGDYDVIVRSRDQLRQSSSRQQWVSKKPSATESYRAYTSDPSKTTFIRAFTHRLRTYLRDRLPEYMVPARFEIVDSLPLNRNGKVDRQALVDLCEQDPDSAREYVAPSNEIESAICQIWAELLGCDRVGLNDDFFELGGHSLLASQVVSRVRKRLGVELPLRRLFEAPTVAGLSQALYRTDEGRRVSAKALVATPRDGRELPLSFSQERLWFLDQLVPESPFYNIATAVRVRGSLDAELLKASFGEIVLRHEALRVCFRSRNGRPFQVVSEETGLKIPSIDLRELSEEAKGLSVARLAQAEGRKAFDLTNGPLIRVTFLMLRDDDYVVLTTMHHIVSDGWSMEILFRDLAIVYRAFAAGRESPLSPLRIQYADFAIWQREWLSMGVLEEQLRYWREQLAGELPAVQLPTDRLRPRVQTYRGRIVPVGFSSDLSSSLARLSREENVTLFMTLFAAFAALVRRYTGQEDLVLGSPVANRNLIEVEDLIGFFVNMLALRVRMNGDLTFKQLLERVRDVALAAYAHQDVPFEKIVAELKTPRDPSRSPVIQVSFALQNGPSSKTQLPDLAIEPLEVDCGTSRFDMFFSLAETARGLKGFVEYNTDLFNEETIERMVGHLRVLLEGIVKDPGRRIAELPLLTE